MRVYCLFTCLLLLVSCNTKPNRAEFGFNVDSIVWDHEWVFDSEEIVADTVAMDIVAVDTVAL